MRVPVRRTVAVAAVLALIAGVVLLLALPERPGPECTARKVASWSAESRFTQEFTRYGNDNTRVDDWTAGDGTHSVRLPDGRTLWIFSDTFTDRVQPPPNPFGQPHHWRSSDTGRTPALIHNSLVVMDRSGHLERTLTGAGGSGPFFPDLPDGWRWPVQAHVEPRTPGSPEQVVRVLLWNRAPGQNPWIFGIPRATEVATLSLPDLRLEGITPVVDQTSVPDPARRVLYGTASVQDGAWTYVYGGDDGPSRPTSNAYLARVPTGRLGQAGAWQYWDGRDWQPHAGRAAPVIRAAKGRGVGSSFTVVRDGTTWVLLSMDTPGEPGNALSSITTYWSCSAQGPWHGPSGRITPPRPADPTGQHRVAAYNPQVHPEFSTPGQLLLSYDINWLGPPGTPSDAQVNGDVGLYRPRFLRLRLGAG
ncbi:MULTISPECIES: DUF4185 domain-containing protein [Streptomyces]|uniref:DUF4185 domain-containing protein n=1 Tax=Streptomyces TaxID=1883 RepID=UPI0004CD4880|nr:MULTISPECIES: DUF4185 domain-containing protein [Streptomyces]KOT56541.1 hypothetical protein ADK43_22830 [Streptomyces rimosus subsp. rimosus]